MRSGLRIAVMVFAAAALVACADRITSVDGRAVDHAISLRPGQTLDILLWAGALGTYADTPSVAGAKLAFLGVSIDGPPNPGGPTQRYRFLGLSEGTAIVTFTPLGTAPVVTDTIIVR